MPVVYWKPSFLFPDRKQEKKHCNYLLFLEKNAKMRRLLYLR